MSKDQISGRSKQPPTFAQNLRAAREQAGLSVVALARASGIHRDTLHKLERGHCEPTLAVAKRLAAAMGCTLDALAGEVPS